MAHTSFGFGSAVILSMSTLAVYLGGIKYISSSAVEWPVLDASMEASVDLAATKTHNAPWRHSWTIS